LAFGNAGTKTKKGFINAVGCDSSATLVLNLYQSPFVGVILGPISGLNTSNNFTYTVTQQLNSTYIWNITNGIIVSGQGTNSVNVQFISAGSSKISVLISNSQGCSDSNSLNLNIGSVGLEKINSSSDFIIYPNPTKSEINFNFDSKLKNSSFRLMDMMGRIIMSGIIESEKQSINLSSFSDGVYLLNLGDNFNQNIKIIKQ
jgi:hypothetical protein